MSDTSVLNRRANPPGKLAPLPPGFPPYQVAMGCLPEPRKVGGTYWCGYWNKIYTVTHLQGMWITGRWEDGSPMHHCTAWDWRRDRIISEP